VNRPEQDAARPVRLRDVAAAAGVNPSIASRILNDDPTLSARSETRTRVREAARALGYTPNAFARGLKLRSTTTLGLVLSGMAGATVPDLIQGAERQAAKDGYVVLLADAADLRTNGSAHRRLLLERRVDGLVMVDSEADAWLLAELAERGMPFVVIDRQPGTGTLAVSADDAAGVELAVDHLAGLGHTSLAYVASGRGSDAASRRLAAYTTSLARHGLRSAGELPDLGVTEDAGFQATHELMRRAVPPTAIVLGTIIQAVGSMAALRAAGLPPPGHVSLVALQDAPLAAYLDPPLTVVRMPVREVAETAVAQLVRRIRGETVDDVFVTTPPEIVVRGSTAPPTERS
jgi:DNA-binding LacI/PurR family transcriptional regulator